MSTNTNTANANSIQEQLHLISQTHTDQQIDCYDDHIGDIACKTQVLFDVLCLSVSSDPSACCLFSAVVISLSKMLDTFKNAAVNRANRENFFLGYSLLLKISHKFEGS